MSALFTYDDGEFEVAEILLELSTPVLNAEAARSFTLSWTVKKPRSLRQRKSSPAVSSVFRLLSSPSVSMITNAPLSGAAEAKSRRQSSKRKRENLLETIDELTRDNKFLKTEIEKINLCIQEQKATNLQLKSRYIGLGSKFRRNSREKRGCSPADDNVDGGDRPGIARVYGQPLIAYRTVRSGLSIVRSYMSPSIQGSYDGDVAREEPLDMSMAKSMAFALARQKRIEIRRSQKLIFAGR